MTGRTRYGPSTGSQANGVSFGAGKKELTDRQARRLAWWDNFGDLAASTAIVRPTATAWILWAALASRPRAAHWVDRFVSEERVEANETARHGEPYVDASRNAEGAAAVVEVAMILVPIAAESRLVSGLFRRGTQAAVDAGAVRPMARTLSAAGDDVLLNKAVNSNLPHAIEQAVEREVFANAEVAGEALRRLTQQISTTKAFPMGTLVDTARPDRFLVPVGENGLAVYQLAKNGTAKLKTVLIAR